MVDYLKNYGAVAVPQEPSAGLNLRPYTPSNTFNWGENSSNQLGFSTDMFKGSYDPITTNLGGVVETPTMTEGLTDFNLPKIETLSKTGLGAMGDYANHSQNVLANTQQAQQNYQDYLTAQTANTDKMVGAMNSQTEAFAKASDRANTLGWAGFAVQAAGAVANITMGIKNYHLAKKQFGFEKQTAQVNAWNQGQDIKRSVMAKADQGYWNSPEEKQAYIDRMVGDVRHLGEPSKKNRVV